MNQFLDWVLTNHKLPFILIGVVETSKQGDAKEPQKMYLIQVYENKEWETIHYTTDRIEAEIIAEYERAGQNLNVRIEQDDEYIPYF